MSDPVTLLDHLKKHGTAKGLKSLVMWDESVPEPVAESAPAEIGRVVSRDEASPLETFVAAYEAATGWSVGRGQKAVRCPAHDDKSPSLSIGEGADGKVIVQCFAGCSFDDIVTAVGLRPADLFPAREDHGVKPRIVAMYEYVDEQGIVLFRVHRREPGKDGAKKDFRQQAASGQWKMTGIRRVLYQLPEIVTAVAEKRVIYVVEGEKDTDRLRSLGHTATTCPGGAGKWRPEYSQSLAGASEVIIIADADEPGRNHARAVEKALKPVVGSVTVLLPARGKDVSDHLNSGLGLGDLVPMPAEDPGPAPGPVAVDVAGEWGEPLALSAALPSFPLDCLPPAIRDIVETVAAETQTPVDLSAFTAMAVLSIATRGRWKIRVRPYWTEETALWNVGLSDSGERKTAVLHALKRPLIDVAKDIAAARKPDLHRLMAELDLLEAAAAKAKATATKSGTPEDKEKACEAYAALENAKDICTAEFRVLTQDVTPESLAEIMLGQGGAIGVLSDEGGCFSTLTGRRYSKDQPVNVDLPNHSFNCSSFTQDRVGRGLTYIERPFLGVCLLVQKYVVREAVEVRAFVDSGLIPRMLFSVPDSKVGTRPFDVDAVAHAGAHERAWTKCVEAILRTAEARERAQSQSSGFEKPSGGEAQVLTLSTNALDVVRQFHNGYEPRLRPGTGDLAPIGEWSKKLIGKLIRIAAIFALAQNVDVTVIGEEDMSRAVGLADYLIDHAKEAFSLAGRATDDRLKEVLGAVQRCVQRDGVSTVGARDVRRSLGKRSWITGMDDVKIVLANLVETGWLRQVPGPRADSSIFDVYPGLPDMKLG